MSDGQEPTGTTPPAGQEPAGTTGAAAVSSDPKTFDESYVKQLRDEAAAARTRAKETEARLKELEDRDKTEAQKLTDRTTAAETRASAAEEKLMRATVAVRKGLPSELVDRLRGSTEKEMEADADQLLKLVDPAAAGGFNGGARQAATKDADMDSLIRRTAGRT